MGSASIDPGRSFVVMVHDVAPVHRRAVDLLVEALGPRAGGKLVAAVVPGWHGVDLDPADTDTDWLRAFGEVLQHGATHLQERPGLISFGSGRSNELDGLSRPAIVDRLARGREVMRRATGVEAAGFLPPAWRMGRLTMSDVAGLGFRYLVGFGSVRPVGLAPISLATWSWDWGIVSALGWAGEGLGEAMHRLRPEAMPCVVAHPVDVDRGFLPRIVRVIDRFLIEGRSPVMFSDLVVDAARETVA